MHSSFRTAMISLVLALIAAVAVPLAAADDGSSSRAEPVKLIVRVEYKDGLLRKPLAGVEVFAFVGSTPHYACTNANGKAVFDSLSLGATVHVLATGPSVNLPQCANAEFRNPDTGDLMFAVFYKNHQGVRVMDPFDLTKAKQSRKLVVKTPVNQKRLCMGFRADIGTSGPDVFNGTPDADFYNGIGGDDTINGLGGNDVLCGGPGIDGIDGGLGDDLISGGKRSDILFGGPGTDTLFGGPGIDTCSGETEVACEI